MAYRRLHHGLLALSIVLFLRSPTSCWGFQTRTALGQIRRVVPRLDSYEQTIYPTSFHSRTAELTRIWNRGDNYQLHGLTLTRDYMKQLEKESGKDYRWIKPLTTPVSRLMKYVDRRHPKRCLRAGLLSHQSSHVSIYCQTLQGRHTKKKETLHFRLDRCIQE